MAKILFVDDEPERHRIFNKKVKFFLDKEFPGIVVHHSKGKMIDPQNRPRLNVVDNGVRYGDVYELIKESIHSQTPYDLIVLDVRLESQPDSWIEGVFVAKKISDLHTNVDYPFFAMISRHRRSKDEVQLALIKLASILRSDKFEFTDVGGEDYPGWDQLLKVLRKKLEGLKQQPQRTKKFKAECELIFEPLTHGDESDWGNFSSGREYCIAPIQVYELGEKKLVKLIRVKGNSSASILLQFLARQQNIRVAFNSREELFNAVNADRPETFSKLSEITQAFNHWKNKPSEAWKTPGPGHTAGIGFGLAANVSWRRVFPEEIEK